jgi:hypothetical protein
MVIQTGQEHTFQYDIFWASEFGDFSASCSTQQAKMDCSTYALALGLDHRSKLFFLQ